MYGLRFGFCTRFTALFWLLQGRRLQLFRNPHLKMVSRHTPDERHAAGGRERASHLEDECCSP